MEANWENSVIRNPRLTKKFDELMEEVMEEIWYLDGLEDWNMNDTARYSLLKDIERIYQNCQDREEYDI